MFNNKLFNTLNGNSYFQENFLGLVAAAALGGAALGGLSGGNTTNVSSSTDINKKMDLKTNVDRSFVVKSVQKLINNVVNEVAQKNRTDIQNSVASSNSMIFNNIDCDIVNYNDIDQTSVGASITSSTVHQKLKNTIKTDISNSITKKISNSLPNNLDSIQNKENEMMKQFMDATPGLDLNAAKNLLGGVSNSGFGNETNINTSYNLNAELKKTLNLDESFKVDDNDEIGNDIKNNISQDNIAKCSTSALAANNITFNDIKCKTANFSDIKQKAISESILSCTFNQEAVNNITTKIMNKLDKTFTKMYESAKDDDAKRKITALSLALGESIQNAGNSIPTNDTKNKESSSNNYNTSDQPLSSNIDDLYDKAMSEPVSPQVMPISTDITDVDESSSNNKMYVISGIIIVFILIIILLNNNLKIF